MKLVLLAVMTACFTVHASVFNQKIVDEFRELVVTSLVADSDFVQELETFMHTHSGTSDQNQKFLKNTVLFYGYTLRGLLSQLDPRLFVRVKRVARAVLSGEKLTYEHNGNLETSVTVLKELGELDTGQLFKESLVTCARQELKNHAMARASLISLIRQEIEQPFVIPLVAQAFKNYKKKYPRLDAISLGSLRFKNTTVAKYLLKHPELPCSKTYRGLIPKSFLGKQDTEKQSVTPKKTGSSWYKITTIGIVLGVAGCFACKYYLVNKKGIASQVQTQ